MNRIKELRLSKNFSQSDLAKLLGCNQTAVGKYEREQLEPNIQILKRLSEIFQVSIGYILGVEDDFGNVIIQDFANTKLTEDEQTLLSLFKKLDTHERKAILAYIEHLAKR